MSGTNCLVEELYPVLYFTPVAATPMLGSSHDRLTVSPARAARTRSAAILMFRFSRAARRIRSDSTGSP